MQDESSASHRSENHRTHRKSDLSPERKCLVERMQDVNYGRIADLMVQGHEPQWSPQPRVFREVVIGKPSGAHPGWDRPNFALKRNVVELCRNFDEAADGTKFSIVVEDGLPRRFTIEEPRRN